MYKALLVDDEEIIRNGLRVVIPWKELLVEELFLADSGEEAVEILKKEEIDFMLTDICMLTMDGLQLIEESNRIRPKMRIVVLTGYDSFDYARQCCKMQVHDFLLKPIDEDILYEVVKNQLFEIEKIRKTETQNVIKHRAVGVTEQFKLEQKMQEIIVEKPSQETLQTIQVEYQDKKNEIMQTIIILPILDREKELGEEWSYLYLSVKNMCISLFDMQEKGITFEDKLGRIIVIVFECKEEIEEQVISLKKILHYETGIYFNILMGSRVEGFANLYLSYHDALSMLQESKNGKNNIYRNEKTNMRLRLFKDTIGELQSMMEDNIGNLEVLLKTYDTFAQCTISYSLSENMIRRTAFQLLSMVYYEVLAESKELEGEKLAQVLNTLLIVKKDEVILVGRHFLQELFSKQEGNVHEFIKIAKEYIKDHLNEELTLSLLAEKVFVTPIYFSRLFKQETGEGCNEYIVRKRMEKAKLLLETTTIRSGEIAFMVGYKDVNYFSIAFKKNTGISPTEYRDQVRN